MKRYYKSAYKFSVLVLTIIFVAAAMGFILSSKVANAAWETPNLPGVPALPVIFLASQEHDFTGSGVVIKQVRTPNACVEYVLTADHVVPTGDGMRDFSDGRHIVITVKRNPMWDLHLLKVLTLNGGCMAPFAAEIRYESLEWGEYVYAIGFAEGTGPMKTEGFFTAYMKAQYGPMSPPAALYSVAVFPGMSGGGYFVDNKLVGIISTTAMTHIGKKAIHSDWSAGPAAWIIEQFLRGTPVALIKSRVLFDQIESLGVPE